MFIFGANRAQREGEPLHHPLPWSRSGNTPVRPDSSTSSGTVDGEVVRAQAGGFYGGWITSEIEGPFKGDPGTQGW